MSQHQAHIEWQRNEGEAFVDGQYSRRHFIAFDGGAVVPGSASPLVVRVPFSDPTAVDPEEAFVASLSACHMLWFLSIAAEDGWVVDHYIDDPEGLLARGIDNNLMITEVRLRPAVAFNGLEPSTERLAAMHERAHEECFLARSVKCTVTCTPRDMPTNSS